MKINDYIMLMEKQKSYIEKYNSIVNKLNEMGIIRSRGITSIGGGIDLSPNEFKKVLVNRNSPKLREIFEVKKEMNEIGKISKVKNWLRSRPTIYKTRVIAISNSKWKYSKIKNKQIQYSFRTSSGDKATLSITPKLDKWETSSIINGNKNVIKFGKKRNLLTVSHPGFGGVLKAKITKNGKVIIFTK